MSGCRSLRGWIMAAAAGLFLGAGTTMSLAETGFVLQIDQAALLSTVATPRVVIVGNPSIADVAVQRDKLVVTGKAYGTTNLILLDENGATISEMPLTVVSDNTHRVSMFKAGKRSTFSCPGTCNPVLDIGDENGFFDDVARQMGTKSGIASGGR